MTQSLSAAMATASKLPPEEQDVLASILLEEIASEECWSDLFAGSQSVLENLAAEAIHDFDGGRTKPLDELE
jgi:hypothetical protein